MSQVRRSRRASMMVRSDQTIADEDERQGQVWERVSRYDMAFGASPTASYVDHLKGRADRAGSVAGEAVGHGQARGDIEARQADLTAGIKTIRVLLGQRGVLIGIRGLGWDDHLLHATVLNRCHHLMEVA